MKWRGLSEVQRRLGRGKVWLNWVWFPQNYVDDDSPRYWSSGAPCRLSSVCWIAKTWCSDLERRKWRKQGGRSPLQRLKKSSARLYNQLQQKWPWKNLKTIPKWESRIKIRGMTIKRTSHTVYDTRYHLVWAPKYRKWIKRADIRESGRIVQMYCWWVFFWEYHADVDERCNGKGNDKKLEMIDESRVESGRNRLENSNFSLRWWICTFLRNAFGPKLHESLPGAENPTVVCFSGKKSLTSRENLSWRKKAVDQKKRI